MRIRSVIGGLLGVVLAAAGAGTAAAAPPPVTCGSYLETDGFLTRDLSCPAGQGITLELDVTLDLRGHTLRGPGAASTTGSGIGVRLSPAWPSRVVNGTIRDWPVAIGGNEDFETVQTAELADLRLARNGTAVLANQSILTIDRSVFRGNAVGVDALSRGELGTRLTVTGSTFRDTAGPAVRVDPRTTISLRDSTFRSNGTGYTVTPGAVDGYDALLERNTFARNGDGVVAGVPGTRLRGNTAVRNAGWGLYAPGAVDLGGNTARRNGRSPQCVGAAC